MFLCWTGFCQCIKTSRFDSFFKANVLREKRKLVFCARRKGAADNFQPALGQQRLDRFKATELVPLFLTVTHGVFV